MKRLVLALAAGATAVLAATAGAAERGDHQLAFVGAAGDTFAIYISRADTAGRRRLTTVRRPLEFDPAWSPDGSRLAFTCGDYELCVASADGKTVRRLTENGWPRQFVYDQEPAWSPDGRRIVFSSNRGGGGYDLWIIGADGTGLRRLGGTPLDDGSPAWSPDGRTIVFDAGRTNDGDLYAIRPDGTGLRRLTNTPAAESSPAFSPDGRRLAFARTPRGKISGSIWTSAPDLSDARRAVPDGERIAFSRAVGVVYGVYSVDPDGTDRLRLTVGGPLDLTPAWQPRRGAPRAPSGGRPLGEPTEDAVAIGLMLRYGAHVAAALNRFGAGSSKAVAGGAKALADSAEAGRRALAAARPASPAGKRVASLARRAFASFAIAGKSLRNAVGSVAAGDPERAAEHQQTAIEAISQGRPLFQEAYRVARIARSG
jgi:TolB protein